MIILHCLTEKTWKSCEKKEFYGEKWLELEGFIHCSDIGSFHRVAPNFAEIKEPLVLLLIDADKVNAKIKWEDGDNCGTAYPHIYGPLNLNAVAGVLPFLRDKNNNFVLNEELRRL